jgi:deoxyribodipyrimidine photolyase-related protein
MESFYRAQRLRLNVLVEDSKPVGGAWNFDKENRSPLPKGYKFPPYLEHKQMRLISRLQLSLELSQ